MSLNLPTIKSGGIATTTQYELLRVGNDPALYLPLDAVVAASGAGVASATGLAIAEGYNIHSGSGSSSAVGAATGEGLAPVYVPSGAGSASVTGSAFGQGYALYSGAGQAAATGNVTGAGPVSAEAPVTPGRNDHWSEVDWSLVARRVEASLERDRRARARRNLQKLLLLMAA